MSDGDGLVPVDDPVVTAFRRWLRAARRWRATRAEQKDLIAAWDEAGALIGGLREIVIATPFPAAAHFRQTIEADADATTIDAEWSEEAKRQRWRLVALKRAIVDFGPAFLDGRDTTYLAGDLHALARGIPSPLADQIPASAKYSANPLRRDAARRQTILCAHYYAGLNGSSWRPEHAVICPKLSDGSRKAWNATVSEEERENCRRVGDLAGKQKLLAPEDVAVEAQILRYEIAWLREWALKP